MNATRYSLINVRQQAASLGVAAVMTLAVMASLGTLAAGYQQDAAQARSDDSATATMAANTAVQQVVIVGKRARG